MSQDHIMMKIGGDPSGAERALAASLGHVKAFSGKARATINESFVSAFKGFGAMLSTGAVLAGLKSLGSKVSDIFARADSAGTSAEFFQGLADAVDKTGGSSQAAEKGMAILNERLGQIQSGTKGATADFDKWGVSLSNKDGQLLNTEEAIFAISDRMSGIKDPAMRAAMAADFFGKKVGGELVGALQKGSAELRTMVENADKFSAAEAKAIHEANKNIEDGIGKISILAGKLINGVAYAGQFWGAFSVGGMKSVRAVDAVNAKVSEMRAKYQKMQEDIRKEAEELEKATKSLAETFRDIEFREASDEEKVNILSRERVKLAEKLKLAEDGSAEFHRLQEAWLKKEYEWRQQILSNEQKKTAELEKHLQLQMAVVDASINLQEAKEERSKLSKDELRNSTDPTLSGDRNKLQQMDELQKQADAARLRGDWRGSEDLLKKRDAIAEGNTSSPEALKARKHIDWLKKAGTSAGTVAEYERNFQNKFGGIQSLKPSETKNGLEQFEAALKSANEDLIEQAKKAGGMPVKPVMGK